VQQRGAVPSELQYVLLLFALFVVPQVLRRYRLPAAITSVALGAGAGMGLGLFFGDPTVALLSTLGITSLFLFAGLDVEFDELRRSGVVLLQHLALGVLTLAAVAALAQAALGLPLRPAVLVALALLTPSAGFILDSLGSLGVSERERFWIKSQAVATELVALGAMFVVLQSTTVARLSTALLALVALVAALPLVFRVFALRVAPYAPKSEFAFLLMVAVLCAFATRRLGVYYLVGAFVVGVAAQRFRERLPAIASERMVEAVERFASFFVPFYFFHAGLGLRREDFGPEGLLVGAGFVAVVVPLRVGIVALHRRLALGESWRESARIAVPLLPTLVFTLVIAEVLRARFAVGPAVFGGLIVYTLVNTLIPGLLRRVPPPEFESPHAPHLGVDFRPLPDAGLLAPAPEAPPAPPRPGTPS
jgi:Kef-type K+ transport system membrane component KefB